MRYHISRKILEKQFLIGQGWKIGIIEINQLKVLGPIRNRKMFVADFIKVSEKCIIVT